MLGENYLPTWHPYDARPNADLAWLRQQLARHTYKPGWTMSIENPSDARSSLYACHFLRISFVTPDSYNPEREIPIQGMYPIAPHIADSRDGDLFTHWLEHTLLQMEHHELQEWLRRDGKVHSDPHAQSGGRS